jgi:hypothetical protein
MEIPKSKFPYPNQNLFQFINPKITLVAFGIWNLGFGNWFFQKSYADL